MFLFSFPHRVARRGIASAVLLVTASLVGACASDFTLENREVPIHVWLSAPGFANDGGSMHARIYVDRSRSVDDVVRFPKGSPTVNLPSVYLRTGPKTVTAEFGRGQIRVQKQVEVEGECWIQITVAGQEASILMFDEQPSPWGTLER